MDQFDKMSTPVNVGTNASAVGLPIDCVESGIGPMISVSEIFLQGSRGRVVSDGAFIVTCYGTVIQDEVDAGPSGHQYVGAKIAVVLLISVCEGVGIDVQLGK